MRALVGTAVQVRAAVTRLHNALGLPRCERLAGTARLDGAVPPDDACSCTDVVAPHEDCRFATRRQFPLHRHIDGTRVALVLRGDARHDARFTAAQRALIAEVADADLEQSEES